VGTHYKQQKIKKSNKSNKPTPSLKKKEKEKVGSISYLAFPIIY
jgi:hypothetical protein